MVSMKFLAGLQMAGLAAAATGNLDSMANNATVLAEFEGIRLNLLEENPRLSIWKVVKTDLETLVPGIQCNLAISVETKQAAPNEDCETVEDSLKELFPEVQCEGSIDWETLREMHEGTQAAGLQRRQTRTLSHITKHHDDAVADARARERDTITSCARATRPGNCRICVVGFTAAVVGEIGVCAAAAYSAAVATAGVITPVAWAAFTACAGGAIANLIANLTGCWAR